MSTLDYSKWDKLDIDSSSEAENESPVVVNKIQKIAKQKIIGPKSKIEKVLFFSNFYLFFILTSILREKRFFFFFRFNFKNSVFSPRFLQST